MTQAAATLLQDALRLSEEERIELAENLLRSLHLPMAEEIRQAWAEEAERRLEQLASGSVQALPAASVFEHLQRNHTPATPSCHAFPSV